MTTHTRTLGRTGAAIPPVLTSIGLDAWADPANDAGFVVLRVERDALDRRGESIVRTRLADIGRSHCDLLIAAGIDGGDLKAGWPIHRLQRFRETGLCRFFALQTHDALEAEWIATHTPVHAVIVDYTPHDMRVRYRVFTVAETAGTAVLAIAATPEELALHRATPQLAATLCAAGLDPAGTMPLGRVEADALWQAYAATNAEPPKLKGAHPPEE